MFFIFVPVLRDRIPFAYLMIQIFCLYVPWIKSCILIGPIIIVVTIMTAQY